jgi:uncharacterized membrane protein HdeD (DUF308 family)
MFGARISNVHGYHGDERTSHYPLAAEVNNMSTAIAAIESRSPAWSIISSILLVIFGLLAIGLPLATSFGVLLIIGWLLILSSAIQAVHAFQSQGIASMFWKLAVALLYLAAGIYLLGHPLLGIAGLTLAIGLFFIAEALMDFLAYFKARKFNGSGWILFDGIGALILGLLIWRQLPLDASWLIGTLVGINMVMTGITRLMISLTIRNHREAYIA